MVFASAALNPIPYKPMDIISLVPRFLFFPSGLLTTRPIKYIFEEPPPSMLYASVHPRSLKIWANSVRVTPLLYPVLRPSTTTNT